MNVSENAQEVATDPFPTWERVDTGPLSWVMSELREAFERSIDSLKTYAQDRDDPTPLKLAKSNLHQAHGALQIVDLEGVSLLTEEIESLMEGFETAPDTCTPEAVEAIGAAYRSITEYLEELLGGAPHQPVRLFPSYRTLLGLRHAERIHPADLFYPDLSVRPPRASSGNGPVLSPAEIAVQRSRFERALLQYLRDGKNLEAAAEMSAAVSVVEASPKQGQQRAFWWVTRAFFEALAGSAVPADLNVKRLCARINLQIRRLLDGSGMVAERLLRDTLFFVARSEAITPHIAEVKEVYSLNHSLPDDFESERYGKINFGALRTAKEALTSAKAAWSHVVGGDVSQIAGFARDASALLAATGSLGRPGLAHVAQVVASLGTELSFDPRKPSEAVGLDVATALLFLESALDQARSLDESFDERAEAVVARVEASAIGAQVEASDTPWLDEISRQAQERLTMASFISEMQANLRTIEKILDGFFREPSQRGELPQAERLLGQIGGALSVLGHEQAGLAIEKGREAITRFGTETFEPDAPEFGRLAESLGAVGFYIENLQHRADVGTVFKFDSESGTFSADLTRGPTQKKAAEEEPDSDPEPHGPGGASPPSGPDAGLPESSVEQEIARHGNLVAELAETLRADPSNQQVRRDLIEALHRVQQDALLVDNSSLKDRAAQALKVLRETSEDGSDSLSASVFDLTDQTHRFGEAWENAPSAPIPEVTAPVPDAGTSVDAELLEIFLTEAVEVLNTARHALVRLGAQPSDREQLTEIRRAFHTLKGSGRMVGLSGLGDAAWAIEQTLNHWLAEGKPATEDLITLLKRAIDELDGWVADLSDLGYSRRLPNALALAAADLREGRALDAPPASPPLPDVTAPSPKPVVRPSPAHPFSGETTEVVAPLRTMEIASEDYMETEVLGSSMGSRARAPDPSPAEADLFQLGIPAPGAPTGLPSAASPHVSAPGGPSPSSPTLQTPPTPPSIQAAPVAAPVARAIAPAMEIVTDDFTRTEALGERMAEDAPTPPSLRPELLSGSDTASTPESQAHAQAGGIGSSASALPGSREPLAPAASIPTAVPPAKPHEIASEDYITTEVSNPHIDAEDQFMSTEVLHEDLDDDLPVYAEPSSMDFDFLHVSTPAPGPAAREWTEPALPVVTPPAQSVAVPPIAAGTAAPVPEARAIPAQYPFDGAPVPPATAPAPAVLPFAIPLPPRADELKQIGPLTLSVPLYNIYLSEADELLRTLTHDFGEWQHELSRKVSEAAVRAAHSLSGTSATIGLTAVHDLAYAVESVLQVLHRTSVGIAAREIALLQDGVEGLRDMLQRFAAANLPEPDVGRIARLLALRDELKVRLAQVGLPAAKAAEPPAIPPSPIDGAVRPGGISAPIPPSDAEGLSGAIGAGAQRIEPPLESGTKPGSPGSPVSAAAVQAVSEAAAGTAAGIAPEAIAAPFAAPRLPGEPPAAQSAPVMLANPYPYAAAADSPVSASLGGPALTWEEEPRPSDAVSLETPPGALEWEAELPEFEEQGFGGATVALAQPPAATDLQEEDASAADAAASEGLATVADALPAPAVAMPSAAITLESVSHVRDEIDPELIEVFLQEASDYLPQIGEGLRRWQAAPRDLSLPQALLRQMHTIKGSARMAGAMRLGEMVHNMESRVEGAVNLRDIPANAFEDLLAAHDRTLELYDSLVHPRPEVQPERRAIRRLEELEEPAETELGGAPALPAGTVETVETVVGTAQAFAAHRAQAGPVREVVQAVRVRADVLDRLVNQAGEVSISRSRLENEVGQIRSSLSDLTENLGRLRGQLREIDIQAETQMQSQLSLAKERERFDPLEFDRFTRLQELTRMMAESVNDVATVHQNLLRSLDGANRDLLAQQRMTRDLQQDLMRVRMVPFSSVSERLYRLVRQTAKELDKRVNLDIRGGGVEIDRSVLERMIAPFEHILRNAIVHGIEARAVRLEKGKAETGELLVEVRQEGNEIVLVFSDDGAGLDLGRIREKGRKAGLIEDGEEIPDARASDLIFQPGFTTASEVTELAGRGVGMDVVRSEASGLGGRVSVDTESERGTRFTINLPLTLAVTQVVLVNVAGRTYALPSVLVEQVQQLRPQPLAQAYNDGHIIWLGQPVKVHFLAGLLGEKDRSPLAQRYSPVLILRSGGERIAVHVDEVVGNQEVVVKNIGPQLARMIGIAGATVLGSGEIVLILNPVQLAQQAHRERPQLAAPTHAEIGGAVAEIIDTTRRAEPVAGLETLPIVMVVDDSLTVRRVTQRLLAREGYQVVLAKDGVDALQQLQDYTPDVMLVDIEMPRMDGFDLTRNVRGDERYQGIPIIMITSRTADKHRSFALELGVNVYLGKPYQEEELLQHLSRFVGNQKRATA